MSENLKKLGLFSSSKYNVSLTLIKDDKEINSLRSFLCETPPFFNKDISTFGTFGTIVTTSKKTREEVKGKASAQTTVAVNVTGIYVTIATGWGVTENNKGKNVVNSLNEPNVKITFVFKQKIPKGKNLSIGTLKNTAYDNIFAKLPMAKRVKNDKKKMTITVNAKGLYKEPIYSAGTWSGGIYLKLGKNLSTGTASYIKESQAKDPVEAIIKTTKTIKLTADPAIPQFMSRTDKIKDIIFFLYSDSTATPTKESYYFLDSSFVAAKGTDVGKIKYTAVSGTKLYSSGKYNFPVISQEDIESLSSSPIEYSKDAVIFYNGDVSTSKFSGETVKGTIFPTKIYASYLLVRYNKNINGIWEPVWLSTDADQNPKIASPRAITS